MIDYDAHKWTDHLFDIKGSMLRQITGRVMFFVAWSVLVVLIHQFVRPVSMPTTVHNLIAVALGLLLVFRTNASYDRFWEGRKLWGGIVNESRNLARAARAYLPPSAPQWEPVVLWTIAFAYACMHSLRGKSDLGPTASRLPKDEVASVLKAQHVPLAIAARISALLATARDQGHLTDFLLGTLDQNVQLLIQYIGACERIHKTPLPFAYVVHLRRAVMIYCFTLPFALVKEFGWVTVLDTLLVAYIFFGIEEIGVQIEDPFGGDDNDLPLEKICGTIECNLMALLDEPPPPGCEEPDAGA